MTNTLRNNLNVIYMSFLGKSSGVDKMNKMEI